MKTMKEDALSNLLNEHRTGQFNMIETYDNSLFYIIFFSWTIMLDVNLTPDLKFCSWMNVLHQSAYIACAR